MKRLDLNFKLLVAIIVVLGLSLSVMAQPQHRGPMPHRPMDIGPGLYYLDLSEEQKDQVKELHIAHLKDVQPLRDEVKINRLKINVLLKNDDPDMKQIVSLVETDGKLLVQIQVKNIEYRISVRNLLTDEQKVIFDEHGEKVGGWRAMAEHHWHRRIPHEPRF